MRPFDSRGGGVDEALHDDITGQGWIPAGRDEALGEHLGAEKREEGQGKKTKGHVAENVLGESISWLDMCCGVLC
ncbi:hypothetical protein BGE01nite_30510 [Brevifollis gellanilyticus]|uniref:Uncharacterized protein n=1 Tax=Brevifollis gellanilyticus TaxID=748831 RepID=A0A512MAK0_9BACT|nr:hypothetical protein BGE01nite_30510 [Brevifollis gellanilyticus]